MHSKKNLLTLLLFAFAGLAGLFVFYIYYPVVFPTAYIDFKITRNDAVIKAEKYLKNMGCQVQDYQSSIYFNYNNGAKEFLEKKLGLQKTQEIIKKEINIWYVEARWFKPQKQEEYRVWIAPSGEITGFLHITGKDAPGKYLDRERALEIAKDFLRKQDGIDIEKLELVKDEYEEMSARRDYTFLWKKKGLLIEGGVYDYQITIQGDKIGQYGQNLKFPEDYLLSEARSESIKSLLMTISSFFYFILFIACLVCFINLLRKNDLTFRFGLLCSIMWATATIISGINSIPLLWAQYSTENTVTSFFLKKFSVFLIAALFTGAGLIIVASTGKALYRRVFRKEGLHCDFFGGIRSAYFSIAIIVGYSVAFFQLGYVTCFYLWTEKYLHAWTPADISYREILSTPIPWIAPLILGLSASLSEELFFRLFAISFLKNLLKNTWLAVIIQAAIWGFLHSNYPQEPFYIRGLEIFFVGIGLGFVFLRYGIIATLISHYVYDAFLGSLILITSSNSYFRISGIIIISLAGLPLIPAVLNIFKKGVPEEKQEAKKDILPEEIRNIPPDTGNRTPDTGHRTPDTYKPLSRVKILVLTGAAITGLMLMIIFQKPTFGDFIKFPLTSGQISHKADEYLIKIGNLPEGSWKTIDLAPNYGNKEIQYLIRNIGTERTNRLFQKDLDYYSWRVRYFTPQKYEETEVYINPEGGIVGYGYRSTEDEAGPRLTSPQAKEVIINFLKTNHPQVNMDCYELRRTTFEDKKNRRDHSFSWKMKNLDIAQALYELKMNVEGNQVRTYFYYLRIPEIYLRKMSEKSTLMSILELLENNLIIIFLILLLIIFIRKVIQNKIPWSFTIKASIIIFSTYLIKDLNTLPGFFLEYQTTQQVSVYILEKIFRELGSLIGCFIAVIILVGTSSSLYQEIFPCHPIGQWRNKLLHPHRASSEYRDLLFVALPGILFFHGLLVLHDYIQECLFLSSFNPGLTFESDMLNCLFPFFKILSDGIFISSVITFSMGILVCLSVKLVKNPLLAIIFAHIYLFLTIHPEIKSIAETLFDMTFGSISIFLLYFLITEFSGHNVFIYFLSLFTYYELCSITPLLTSSSLFYLINAYLIILFVLLPYMIIIFIQVKKYFLSRSNLKKPGKK